MAIFDNFPYTDFHQLNLDWIIAKVKEYIAKVDVLEIDFNDLKTYVTDFFDNLDVQKEVDSKLDEMYADGTLTAIINSYIALRSQHKYIFIGDSFMNNASEPAKSIMTYLPGYMGLTSDDFFDASKSGDGFARTGHEYLSSLMAIESSISDKSLITDIIVIGGWNDRNFSLSVVGQAMADFSAHCRTNFPNAAIKVAYVGWTGADSVSTRREAINGIFNYQQCGKYGMSYISNSHFINHIYDYFDTDLHHPSEDGARNMAEKLAAAIREGSADVLYQNISIQPTVSAIDTLGISAISGSTLEVVMNNELTEINSSGTYIRGQLAQPTNIAQGWYNFMDIPLHLLRPFQNYANNTVIIALYDGSSWTYTPGAIGLAASSADNRVTVQIYIPTAYSNIERIQFNRINLTMSSLWS